MNKFLIVLATLLTGASFWLADEAVNDLPARVDVDGRLLRMRVQGEGAPTVVLEIGIGGPLEEWELVRPEIARFTKVVAYDRVGAVETKAKLTGQDVARELHAALRKAEIDPPYVLVGQSMGGMYNRVFASLYPDEVVGMVLLDPSQEEFLDWMKIHHPDKTLSPELIKAFATAAGFWETLTELKTLGPLPNVPVTVVTATKFINDPVRIETLPIWTASHAKWVKALPQGRHVLAPESGHGVQVENPQLVIRLIRETVDAREVKPACAERLYHEASMTSTALGIGYAFWLRLRWAIIGVVSLMLVLALSVQLFPNTAVYCCGASMVILFAATVFLLNAFTLGPADLGVKSSGFPLHMRVLPASTRALVGWPMLFAATTFAILWALPVGLIFMPAGFPLPIVWPAAMFATLCLWVQAIGWSPFPSPFARVPMLILAIGPMTLPLSLGVTFYEGTALAAVFSISCSIWSIAAYVFGVKGLSRARTGSEGDWFRPITQWWASRAQQRYAAGHLRRPFRSTFTAQLWHESRRNAVLLPAMTAFVGLPMLLVLLLPILSHNRQQSFAFGSTNLPAPMFILLLWGALPTLFAMTQGGGMAKLDIWGKTAMPAFFATRPMTTSRFILIKLCATALSVVGSWMITLVLFAVWAALETSPLNMHDSIIRAILAEATPRTSAIFFLAVIGIMAITWRNVVSGMWPTLTGRKHIANGIGFGFLAALTLIGGGGMWMYQHPAYQDVFWRLVPWIIGAEITFKLGLAVWLSITLQRRGLVTPKTTKLLAAGWLVLAGCLIGGLTLIVVPTWTLVAIVVLLLPFPSLAAAPLALDWNRHR